MAVIKASENHEGKQIESMLFPSLGETESAGVADGPLQYEDLGRSGSNIGGAGIVIEAKVRDAFSGEVETAAREIRGKAEEEARQIVEEAERQAQEILARTQKDAEAMVKSANEKVEANKKEGFQSGYGSGEEAGYKAGFESGFGKGKTQAAEEVQSALQALDAAKEQLLSYKMEILSDAQKDIVQMAIAIAEKILHKELLTDQSAVLSLVKNALSKVSFKKKFLIRVNPVDLEVIQAGAKELAATLEGHESLKVQGDPKIEPGGCVIQTESGTVDARIDRQLDEVKNAVMAAMDQSAES